MSDKELAVVEKLMEKLIEVTKKPVYTGFYLTLDPVEITTLHGALILVSKHPGVQERGSYAIIQHIIEKIEKIFLRFVDSAEIEILKGGS